MRKPVILLPEDLPSCECCGRPIMLPGLCGACAQYKPLQVPIKVVVIDDRNIIHPKDLFDRYRVR